MVSPFPSLVTQGRTGLFIPLQRLLSPPQLGQGGRVLPDGPKHISQPHGQPAFLNRESR